ncbi:helix-turn-helix transcriptional regulator [Sporosarcina thermotolerans]|uniref:Helix-turn-helix transcriptional regulator n=1 Tax=Sporosarcina thermotolerans TaxID=633404 RepID=A0AAW9AEG9_9BACL|nr:helix-turn-helix transcriptional regulator [Sporosarcina thermotolerans]MDW0118041.1 helix-turn-helix transcriptional regulator [Sporosarcina thermotolerans]
MFPLQTLGERIRVLRKQRKLTLEALAGEQLTKGMLSLIENNKANPSMESLSYIAERLGIEVSKLLEEVNPQELRDLLKTVEKLFTVEVDELKDEYKQILELVEPYVEKLSQGYEAARLLEIYSRALYYEKKDGWQELLNKAGAIYDQMNIIRRLAAVGMFRSMVKFTEHDYESALDILLKERSEIEERSVFIDSLTRLDFDYLEAVLHYAVGDADEAIRVMNAGIEFSKENQVFYRIDHLYRLATFHAMMNEDLESMEYYERKLLLYGEFADDKEVMFFTIFAKVHYLTSYKKEYKAAMELIDAHYEEHNLSNWHTPYSYMEKGKVLYGLGKFEEALSCFGKIVIADYIHHPFDLSIFYEKDAYAALCYLELGDKAEAHRSIEIAVDNISSMPRTPYKDFIMKTYESIRK